MKIKEVFKNKINKKRLLIVLAVFAVISVMIFSNPEVQEFLFGQENAKLSFQSGVEYEPFRYGEDMLLVSNEGIRAIDDSGKDSWTVVHQMTAPMTVVKGNYIMVASMNGTGVNVYKKNKPVSQIKTENEILTAKMNKDGYVAVATTELGYKGSVTVYKRGGEEIFKWYSGAGYIGNLDIDSKGNLVVAQIMTDREAVYSRIMLIDTKNKKEAQCIAEKEGIVMKLRLNGSGKILAVSDEGVSCYKKDGKVSFEIDFGGRVPKDCNVENDDNLVFAFDSGLNNTILESYSASGKLRGSHEANGKIRAFDVCGEYIMYSTINGVTRISPKGKVKGEMSVSNDVKNLKIFSDRERVMSLGGSHAEILKIN